MTVDNPRERCSHGRRFIHRGHAGGTRCAGVGALSAVVLEGVGGGEERVGDVDRRHLKGSLVADRQVSASLNDDLIPRFQVQVEGHVAHHGHGRSALTDVENVDQVGDVRIQAHGAVVEAGDVGKLRRRERLYEPTRHSRGRVHARGRITRHHVIALRNRERAVEDAREFRAGPALRDIRNSRQRPEGEQIRLRAVAHHRVAVAAGDLLALDRAVHGPGLADRVIGTGRSVSGRGVRGLGIVVGRNGVSDGAGWTLNAKRLSHRGYREGAQQAQCNPTACIKHNASNQIRRQAERGEHP